MYALYLLPLLMTAGIGVYYYCFRSPTHMKKFETAFIQKYGKNNGHELVKLPPALDVVDEKVLQKLCSYTPKTSVANAPVKEAKNNFVGFRVEIHKPIPVELIRCNETYAIIAALTSERIFVLKRSTIRNFKGTVFYLEAEIRFELPPSNSDKDSIDRPVIPQKHQSSKHDASGHSESHDAVDGEADAHRSTQEIENDHHHSEVQLDKSSSSDASDGGRSSSVRRRTRKQNNPGENTIE